jgi:hypothetical protein
LDFPEGDRDRQAESEFIFLLLNKEIAVEPVETVKKPSVLGEALFKPLWESAW